MRSRRLALLLGGVGLVVPMLTAPSAAASTAAVTTYTYVDLGWLAPDPAGAPRSGALDVNERRQVVGYSSNERDSSAHAFLWQDGAMAALGAILPGGSSTASAVNDHGDVVGQTHVSTYEPSHAFLYRDGRMTDLGTGWGSGSRSSADDVNNDGVVVGQRGRTGSSPTRAVLWKDGVLRDLGTLGGRSTDPFSTESEAHAINDKGQVVGAALPRTGYPLHGFLWEDGRMRDLGSLGGAPGATVAYDVNERTQIVGHSQNPAGRMSAFLWEGGVMRDLGVLPGGTGSVAYGINEAGQVVGTSRTNDGYYGQHAFVWQDGRMTDLNAVTTNLPADVSLELAYSINDEGVIAGQTCLYCESGKTAATRAFLLIPNS
uniref:DUF3466 family protein n=1 Tax=Nonomuraea pusilla TaxID=46177 RepID=UPI000A8A2B9A|nr:DUF3466 family protein [Nonomuraea pusilla]